MAGAREPTALDDHYGLAPEQQWQRRGVALVVVGALAGLILVGVLALPRGGNALPGIARQALQIALPKWGTTEVVSEIVYGSRGWDTFGETFLLLAAVVAVVVLSRSREHRSEYVGEAVAGRREQRRADPHESVDREESEARRAEHEEPGPHSTPMTVVVQYSARIAAVVLGVAGIYLAAWGYTPGGGFPGGAVLAGVAILIYAACGYRRVGRVLRSSVLEPVEMLGAALIVVVAVGGWLQQGHVLKNWIHLAQQQTIRAGGTLQIFSGAELIEVATGITIAIFSLLGMEHSWSPDEQDDPQDDEQDDPQDDEPDDRQDDEQDDRQGGRR